jgi:hypothetical protein
MYSMLYTVVRSIHHPLLVLVVHQAFKCVQFVFSVARIISMQALVGSTHGFKMPTIEFEELVEVVHFCVRIQSTEMYLFLIVTNFTRLRRTFTLSQSSKNWLTLPAGIDKVGIEPGRVWSKVSTLRPMFQ